ncbi:flagellar biosynthetic protein FliO [Castellaniella sp.]|uniref:flagellar biosynthetic protein FliO n=1 Tax=Castellaniella sp. TaxID=1955812 RepID=UPI002AFDCC23|nr:flagellar biosynthetic protein FliO [Castellaniella sp.]
MDQAQILRVVLALLFILVLLLALAWAARRGGWARHSNKATNLRVLGSHSLGTRCSLTVVQIDGARLLLGVTPQQITLLHTSSALPDTPAEHSDFAESLSKTLSRS